MTNFNWCIIGDAYSFSNSAWVVLLAAIRLSFIDVMAVFVSANSGESLQISAQSRFPIRGELPAPMASSMNSATLSLSLATAPCRFRYSRSTTASLPMSPK